MGALQPFWRPPAAFPALASHEVHVWSAFLEALPSDPDLLAPDEKARAARFVVEPARRQFVAARALLRTILGTYLGADPRGLTFGLGPVGKPFLTGIEGPRLHFNVSHSHEVLLLAVTRRGEVGVDVEKVRPFANAAGVAGRFFSPAESTALEALPEGQRPEAFFQTWTRKEAFLKAHGGGISHGLERVEVSVGPGEPGRIVRLGGDEVAAGRWSLADLVPAAGYAGALVMQDRGYSLSCWHWGET